MASKRGAERVSPVKNFFAGGVGGVSLILAGQPLDTIKVKLQTQPRPLPGQNPRFASTLDCFRKIVAREGFRGLYKGMGAPLAVATPIMAVSFFGFGLGKKLQQRGQDIALRPHQVCAAGMLAGGLSAFIMAPGERIKCLLQVRDIPRPPESLSLVRFLCREWRFVVNQHRRSAEM
ncbi:mitochondrial carnitine/acylcarnitine carrier protein-like [Ascaphus truei]|uniref:mitochondrial carnitine/acylcarnitine carrier protein-like n=1 Tax=Ascaphus truei TaxID=8439 RepID=UPI003F59C1F0